MTLARRIALLMLFGLWTAAAVTYPNLPAKFPTRFGGSGQPIAWATKSPGLWFLLPLAAVGLLALFRAMSPLMRRWPHLVNLPEKPRFLALPPERREIVLREIDLILDWSAVHMLSVFWLIQVAMYEGAHGRPTRGWFIAVLVVALTASPILLPMILIRVRKAMDRAEQAEA